MNKLLKFFAYFLVGITILVMHSCRDIYDQEIYQRPDWLAGKITEQVKSQEDLTIYAKCLDATMWGDIVGKTGFYTAFAPTDEAFEAFFAEHPKYNSFDDFLATPEDSIYLDGLVRYSLIYNGWTKRQLTTMTPTGFYDPKKDNGRDFSAMPIGFKRETAFKALPRKEYVVPNVVKLDQRGLDMEVDEIKLAPGGDRVERMIASDGNKYLPIFYKAYFDAFDYAPKDYEFYFKRAFDESEIYVAGAKIVSDEFFAENGVVYKIDKVVEPLKNIYEILKGEGVSSPYSDFFELYNAYSKLVFLEAETKQQPGYSEGLAGVENLYAIYHMFDEIDNESFGSVYQNSAYLISLLAPTNEQFNQFFNSRIYLGYPYPSNFEQLEFDVILEVLGAYAPSNWVYKTEIDEKFFSVFGDSVELQDDDIREALFASNGTFIGLNKSIVPRILNTVSAPIVLRLDTRAFKKALVYTGVVDKAKRLDRDYTLFAIDDNTLGEATDSSLVIRSEEDPVTRRIKETFYRYDKSYIPARQENLSRTAFVNMFTPIMQNQLCYGTIEGNARYEFLKTIGGYYVRIDNVTNTAMGTSASVRGYNGIADTILYLNEVDDYEYIQNGKTYMTYSFFNFESTPSLMQNLRLVGKRDDLTSRFWNLCIKAGIVNESGDQIIEPGITATGLYTVFVPTDGAIEEYEEFENVSLDNMDAAELKKILLYHFVKGEMIFTHGKENGGPKTTLLTVDNTNATLNLETGYDYINILDKEGEVIETVEPEVLSGPTAKFTKTNVVGHTQIADPYRPGGQIYYHRYATSVMHEINSVLVFEK